MDACVNKSEVRRQTVVNIPVFFADLEQMKALELVNLSERLKNRSSEKALSALLEPVWSS